ncbi:MAG: transcriptional repressor [Chloroflexi bacterium]|nr:transcriptional repressor [Chloroflexota bacterium]
MKETLNLNAQAVLEAVSTAPHHPTALEIYETVKHTRPHIGLATVYRILHLLVGQEYIKELRYSDESCRYDAHTARHDHAICVACGGLFDLPVAVELSHEALERASQTVGMQLTSHEVRLYGRCPSCQQQNHQ